MIASKNKPAGKMNKYGVNFSREGDIFVLLKKFLADLKLIIIILFILWAVIVDGKRLPSGIVYRQTFAMSIAFFARTGLWPDINEYTLNYGVLYGTYGAIDHKVPASGSELLFANRGLSG
jgi:hypothetical protein